MVSLDKSVKGICKVLQFADDMAIYTTDTSPQEVLPELENNRFLNMTISFYINVFIFQGAKSLSRFRGV
jgi:hypothetical protein